MNISYLKIKLKTRNISIYKLSKLADLDDGMLNRIINGKTTNPRIDTLIKIAKALDLSEHEFAELCDYKVNKQSCIPLEIKDENDKTFASITDLYFIESIKSISLSSVYCSGTIRNDFSFLSKFFSMSL